MSTKVKTVISLEVICATLGVDETMCRESEVLKTILPSVIAVEGRASNLAKLLIYQVLTLGETVAVRPYPDTCVPRNVVYTPLNTLYDSVKDDVGREEEKKIIEQLMGVAQGRESHNVYILGYEVECMYMQDDDSRVRTYPDVFLYRVIVDNLGNIKRIEPLSYVEKKLYVQLWEKLGYDNVASFIAHILDTVRETLESFKKVRKKTSRELHLSVKTI